MASTRTAIDRMGYARTDVLVDQDWLEQHLDDAALTVVEVDVSAAAYEEGDIAGAVLWNVYRDLKETDYQLVDTAALARLLSRSGITAGSTVVFYGYAPAMGFWLMKLYRHAEVRILDCSRRVWHSEGRPWTTDVRTPVAPPCRLPAEDDRIRADHATVETAIGDPRKTILDVRTTAEYRGDRFWPSGGFEPGGRAGHVPTALNTSIDGVHDERGSFRSAAELREAFEELDTSGDHEIICYCTIGGRASTAWFVLTYLLGHRHVRVYDGSWAEWGRMPAMSVECATA
jgi:thiosulfate/3-mercaptopyruvate sulfurtransferase